MALNRFALISPGKLSMTILNPLMSVIEVDRYASSYRIKTKICIIWNAKAKN